MTKKLADDIQRTIDEEAGIVIYRSRSVRGGIWGVPIGETDLADGSPDK